jgi:hypothetical protein
MGTMKGEDMEWVVRAGVAAAGSLIKGYRMHARVPGLYGLSVQYAPGKTVDELAQAGQYPHPMISYATTDALTAALRPLVHNHAALSGIVRCGS